MLVRSHCKPQGLKVPTLKKKFYGINWHYKSTVKSGIPQPEADMNTENLATERCKKVKGDVIQ